MKNKEEIKTDEIILRFNGLYLMDIYANWNTIENNSDYINDLKPYEIEKHSIEIEDTILYDISDEALLNVLNRSFDFNEPVPEVAIIILSRLFQDDDGKVKYKEKIKQLYYTPKPLEKI